MFSINSLWWFITIYDKIFRNRLKEYGRKTNESNHQVVQSIHEAIEGLKDIRVLSKEDHFRSKLEQGAKSIAYYNTRHQLLNLVPGYLLEFFGDFYSCDYLRLFALGHEFNSLRNHGRIRSCCNSSQTHSK